MKTCKICAIGKARQKNVLNESSGEKAKVPNSGWFHDIDTGEVTENLEIMVTYLVWHMIVDKATGTKISGFYKAKKCHGQAHV